MSCHTRDSAPRVPPNILPPDSMAIVLKDLHLIHAYVTQFHPQQYDSLTPSLFLTHLTNLHIDTTQFFTSYNYYLNHPDLLQQIYAKILDLLKQEKTYWERKKPKMP